MLFNVAAFGALIQLGSCLISDVPGLNGPIPPTNLNNIKFGKTRPSEFQHPGLWHSHEDLERIRNGVMAKDEPWNTAYQSFSVDSYSLANYTMQGPKAVISRGSISNYSTFANDARAAWQNSLMWYITKDQGHWDRATTILDAWGSNLTNIIGTDRSLMIGLDGQLFVNAAEIMRWEGGWVEQGASYRGGVGFSIQLYWLFARQSIIIGQSNYGMASISALLSFAVYLEDVSMYNYALDMYQNDLCGGVQGNVDLKTGQSAESGRDQSHATSGIFWASTACRTVQSQGGDMFSLFDNVLLKGAEYSAKYNLNNTVEYDPKFYRCTAVLVDGPWENISDIGRGLTRQVWDLPYYHFNQRAGLPTPYLSEVNVKAPVEGHVTSNDGPSWGDLIWPYKATSSSNGNNTSYNGSMKA